MITYINSSKKMKRNINIQDLQKRQLTRHKNVGYKNEYFYITYSSRSLKEYRKYYEPLIRKNDKEFKEGMERARKEVNYAANTDAVATLFFY